MSGSDEELRKAQKPVISLRLCMDLLQTYWGIHESTFTKLKALDSYDDCNIFVEAGDKRYLFKAHNGVESQNHSILEAQTAMLKFLAQRGIRTNIPVSPVQPYDSAPQSIVIAEVPVFDGTTHKCALRLWSWVDGAPLVGNATPRLLVHAGELLGKIQNLFISENFDHKGLHRYHQWDLHNTSDIRNFTRHIQNEDNRNLVLSVVKEFEEIVLPISDQLRKGPLHADFNDANIILPSNSNEELGVIDFGDIVNSWVVNDIAIAAAYATVSSFGKVQPFSAAAAVIHGCSNALELTQVEKDLLLTLSACRLAISVTLGAYSYQQQPECTYLLLHAEPAWNSLKALTNPQIKEKLKKYFASVASPTASTEDIMDRGEVLFAEYTKSTI